MRDANSASAGWIAAIKCAADLRWRIYGAAATFATLLAAAVLLGAGSTAALAVASAWSPAEESRLRLLLGGVAADGTIPGAIEIEIEPGWHTYWRYPGEVGLPPAFDFSRSENVAAVDIRYPAPERHDDGASVSLIYRDEVVFPFALIPERPGAPVTLAVNARFGVCSTICIPTGAEAAVTMRPENAPDAATATRLSLAEARVPGPPQPGRFEIEGVRADGDDLFIDVLAPQSTYRDLFVAPPDGWFVGQPQLVLQEGARSRYRMSLAGRPHETAVAGQQFRFLAVAGGEAIEEIVTLP
jgi:DsbC/DsbD-like thiol-disulfide interchange protein